MRSKSISPSPHHVEIVLRISIEHDRIDVAMKAIMEMSSIDNRIPSMRCYAVIFEYLAKKDLPVLAVELLHFMSSNGQRPDATIFSIVEKMRRYDVVLEGIESMTRSTTV